MCTLVDRKLSGDLLSVCRDFVDQLLEKFSLSKYNFVHPTLFVNMVESAVVIKANHSTKGHLTGSKFVLIKFSDSNIRSFVLCMDITSDGTELPLFLIEGTAKSEIEKFLNIFCHQTYPGAVSLRVGQFSGA